MEKRVIEQVFNANDIPWEKQKFGKSKCLVGPEITNTGSLRLLLIASGEHFKSHEQDLLQIMYFISGEGIVSIDDKKYTIDTGLTIIILPNQCHSVKNTGDANLEIMVYESNQINANDTPFIDF